MWVLTYEGTNPVEYAFLVDDAIYVWNPDAYLQRLGLHSSALSRACKDHLRATNRTFESLDEAIATIIAQKWRNWEKLLGPCDRDEY